MRASVIATSLRIGWIGIALTGCAPAPSGTDAAGRKLAAERDLDIRNALHDVLEGDETAAMAGRDALIRIGAPAVPALLEAIAIDAVLLSSSRSSSSGVRGARALRKERLQRHSIAFILGVIGDKGAVPALLERYDGEAFGRALEKITGMALGNDLVAWREWYVAQPPAAPGEVEEALRRFRRQDPSLRVQTVKNLMDAVRPRTGVATLEAMKDAAFAGARRQLQILSAQDLDRLRAARPLLAEALCDEEPDVFRCAHLLAAQMGHLSVDLLRAEAVSGAPHRRHAALQTLGTIGDPRAIPEAAAALSDDDPFMRQRAAWALGKIGRPEGAPPLEKALAAERDPSLRPALLMALVMTGRTARFDDLVEGLRGPPAESKASALQLKELFRQACMCLGFSREAWLEAWSRQDPGNDPAKWQAWWTGPECPHQELFAQPDGRPPFGRPPTPSEGGSP